MLFSRRSGGLPVSWAVCCARRGRLQSAGFFAIGTGNAFFVYRVGGAKRACCESTADRVARSRVKLWNRRVGVVAAGD